VPQEEFEPLLMEGGGATISNHSGLELSNIMCSSLRTFLSKEKRGAGRWLCWRLIKFPLHHPIQNDIVICKKIVIPNVMQAARHRHLRIFFQSRSLLSTLLFHDDLSMSLVSTQPKSK